MSADWSPGEHLLNEFAAVMAHFDRSKLPERAEKLRLSEQKSPRAAAAWYLQTS
jgi:hypothetical protein